MDKINRYELRVVQRYSADGEGDVETDASMKLEPRGRYVLFEDVALLLAERDTALVGLGKPAAWVRASYLRVEHLGYFEASATRFSPAQVPLWLGPSATSVAVDRELLSLAVSIPSKASAEENHKAIIARGKAQAEIRALLTGQKEAGDGPRN